jgi:tetratricopeptide (TPR) repeat protein
MDGVIIRENLLELASTKAEVGPVRYHRIALAVALIGLGPVFATGQQTPDAASRAPRSPVETETADSQGLTVIYPFNETVFPPDIGPPTFRWQEAESPPDMWQITLRFQDSLPPVLAVVRRPEWSPDPSNWDSIKRRSREKPVHVDILALRSSIPDKVVHHAHLSFSTSSDEVGAPIFYRDVNLPFVEAVKDPSAIRWRFGSISSTGPPPVVLEHLPVCGNCHSFSRDGRILGMDVDYANSKGSYVITTTAREMTLLPKEIITWDEYKREDGELTFGLLSQVSPDGQWVASTVKDKSVFVPRPNLAFSQLFFPLKGIIALYNRHTGKFQSLPGADDPQYVQTNPNWSPDGRYILFARAKAYNLTNTAGHGKVLLLPEECREFTRDGKPFRYDIYRIPFNDGKGGTPEPLAGASGDDRSNYFPRYSPDGRWIVFCKAKNYMLLQPDSELFVVPASGGQARRLRCNLPRMNSWHSWSPNSRWLVFSSKAFSDYTQLFLTHIDDQGESTPPVLIERFTATNRAANIPEFVNLPANGIVRIQEKFLNDYSFERAGNEFYRSGEPDRAIEKYRQALALNPSNVNAHQRLGFLMYNVKHQFEEGLAHTAEALRLDPKNSFAHSDMGMILLNQNQPDQAIPHLHAALESLPITTDAQYKPEAIRYNLAQAYMQLARFPEATSNLQQSVRLDPNNPQAHYLLALALVCQGSIDEALRHYSEAVALKPEVDSSVTLHELLAENYAKAGRLKEAVRSAEHARKLARAAGKDGAEQRINAQLLRYKASLLPDR